MLLHAHGEAVLRVKGLLNVGATGPVVLNGVQHILHPRSILPPGQARTSAPIWSLFSTPLILRLSARPYRRFNTSWAPTRRLTVIDNVQHYRVSHRALAVVGRERCIADREKLDMDRIVAYLSDYTAALTFEELPAEVVHHAKRMLIDTLGCAIGGFTSEPSKVARSLAEAVTSQQPATVLGSGQQTSLDLATFANGVMMRYLDFNDGYTSKESGHPSDAIAVLSPAEVVHGSGKR